MTHLPVDRPIYDDEMAGEEPIDPDERLKIDMDPEDAVRELLNREADPQKIAAALERLRTALPQELAIPEHQNALITDARMAGATMDQIKEALETPR